MDNFIQRINPYPVVKIGAFLVLIDQQINFIHCMDRDLSTLHASGPSKIRILSGKTLSPRQIDREI